MGDVTISELNANVFITMEKALRTMRTNVKKIIDEFGLSDLTFAEINTLISIGEGSKSMKEIVSDMAIANSTPTRIIDTLVNKNIVERHNDIDDRRKVIVKLTDIGINIYSQIINKRSQQLEMAFKGLTDNEKSTFINTINIVMKNMENEDGVNS